MIVLYIFIAWYIIALVLMIQSICKEDGEVILKDFLCLAVPPITYMIFLLWMFDLFVEYIPKIIPDINWNRVIFKCKKD